jgi:hypothetical protein
MNDIVQLVKEQDKWTPLLPPGHWFQLAILTWLEGDDGPVAPWAIMRMAVPRLAELVKADQIAAEYLVRKRRGLLRRWHEELDHDRPWADLMGRSDADLQENGEFPHQITFKRDGALVLLEQTSFWNQIGGPAPYHDSVALSFSSALVIQDQIEDILLDSCRSLGISQS